MKKPIWERQDDTASSWQAFCDYKRLPVPRTLSALQKRYRDITEAQAAEKPPTTSMKTLRNWCAKYKWKERARSLDAAQGALIDQRVSEAKADEAIKEVEEYARTARSLGRGNANVAIALTKIATDFLRTGAVPSWLPPIREWNDIGVIVRASATTQARLELWGQAIGFDKVKELIEQEGEASG